LLPKSGMTKEQTIFQHFDSIIGCFEQRMHDLILTA
jgi:hypothetical protein